MYWINPHSEVLEEEVAPVVLDVEEEAKDEAEVHQADEDDHHHPTVYGHLPYHQGYVMGLQRPLLEISPVEILLLFERVRVKAANSKLHYPKGRVTLKKKKNPWS